MTTDAPNIVDYTTLVVATFGPLAAFLTTRWAIRRNEKSRFDAYISWRDYGPNSQIEEAPLLHLHNKGQHSIFVTDVRFFSGPFRKKAIAATALYYEDPLDLSFPYEIAAGHSRSLMLDEAQVIRVHANQIQKHRWESILQRSSIAVRVRTADGMEKRISAIDALPWHLRPNWSKIADE